MKEQYYITLIGEECGGPAYFLRRRKQAMWISSIQKSFFGWKITVALTLEELYSRSLFTALRRICAMAGLERKDAPIVDYEYQVRIERDFELDAKNERKGSV